MACSGAGRRRGRSDRGAVAGFAAYGSHLSYMPHSGSVLAALADDVAPYETSKGALRFAIDEPLPQRLVRKLIRARMNELGLTYH